MIRFGVVALLLVSAAAQAEVADSVPRGFTVTHTRKVAAAPAALWQTLIAVEKWWDPQHTYSGSAANLSIDARAGGCFCEKLAGGGSVMHAQVVLSKPGALLRLVGALGPLQEQGVAATLSFEILPPAAGEKGSQLKLTYRVGGYVSEGLGKWVDAVNNMLGAQMDRLKKLLDAPAR